MISAKYLLVGGGLASHAAAKRIREMDAQGAITIIGKEPHPPYDRPPLTKEFMQGKKPREKVFLEAPEYYREHSIDLLLGAEVET